MDATTFERFMQAQCAAIESSGLDPETWIELHAEQFRQSWAAEPQPLH